MYWCWTGNIHGAGEGVDQSDVPLSFSCHSVVIQLSFSSHSVVIRWSIGCFAFRVSRSRFGGHVSGIALLKIVCQVLHLAIAAIATATALFAVLFNGYFVTAFFPVHSTLSFVPICFTQIGTDFVIGLRLI